MVLFFKCHKKNVFSNNWWPQQVEIDPCEIDSNYIASNNLCTITSLSIFYKSTEKFSFKLLQYPKRSSFSPCFGSLFAQPVLTVYSACSHRAFNLHTRCISIHSYVISSPLALIVTRSSWSVFTHSALCTQMRPEIVKRFFYLSFEI